MKNVDDARALAAAMVAIGPHAGMRTEAFITDMDAPLGSAIGNSARDHRVRRDAERARSGRSRRRRRCASPRGWSCWPGSRRDSRAAARSVEGALRSGRALETFGRMIEAHGGNPRIVDDYDLLPQAPDREVFRAATAGFVATVHAEALGRASNVLGAGRHKVGDPVDHAVGLVGKVVRGERVYRRAAAARTAPPRAAVASSGRSSCAAPPSPFPMSRRRPVTRCSGRCTEEPHC